VNRKVSCPKFRIWDKGFKEITLWDKTWSYLWYGGLKKILKMLRNAKATALDFDQLLKWLRLVSQNAHPILDFKPQDMHESVLHNCENP
jgi:hypothetical protein